MLHKADLRLTTSCRGLSMARTQNERVTSLSVAHELSSEIAAAILARKQETRDPKELKDIVVRVHTALQKLTAQCREQRLSNRTRPVKTSDAHPTRHRAFVEGKC